MRSLTVARPGALFGAASLIAIYGGVLRTGDLAICEIAAIASGLGSGVLLAGYLRRETRPAPRTVACLLWVVFPVGLAATLRALGVASPPIRGCSAAAWLFGVVGVAIARAFQGRGAKRDS